MFGVITAQMFDRGDHMDGGRGWGWLMIIVLVVVIGLAVWAVVRSTRSGGPHPHDRAREILAERLATGEITPEEYRERSQQLK